MRVENPNKRSSYRSEHPAELKEGLARLARDEDGAHLSLGTRLRNYFLTGLVVVGPVTITVYIAWWFINVVDAWIKPFLPRVYNPDTYLPFPVPGFGIVVSILGLTMVGALAANLLGRTMISYGEVMVGRMPIVRNVYRTMKQIFESVVSATGPEQPEQKVGLIEFPSKGLWSIVFVTGETSGEIAEVKPGGQDDMVSVFMPTGIVPPTGFVCFVPRREVMFLDMSMEDAAKVIISGGMVMPETQERMKELADQKLAERKEGLSGLGLGGKKAAKAQASSEASEPARQVLSKRAQRRLKRQQQADDA
jgi:uncharacterized membrane protein